LSGFVAGPFRRRPVSLRLAHWPPCNSGQFNSNMRLKTFAPIRVVFGNPLRPCLVVFAIEFQPAFLSSRRCNSIFVPSGVECFEFKSFLDCETDQHAPPNLVDKIPSRRVVSKVGQAAGFLGDLAAIENAGQIACCNTCSAGCPPPNLSLNLTDHS
jgi:hypothetical protein